MENTKQFNPDLRTIGRTAKAIDRIHPCADCPMRLMAIKQPRSIFARIHAWHRTWWPGWKAHEAKECVYSVMTKINA